MKKFDETNTILMNCENIWRIIKLEKSVCLLVNAVFKKTRRISKKIKQFWWER